MDFREFDLVVIGAGVGGYVASIRAAQLGMKVACIDRRDTLGGTCLNEGCIPSKALLHSSHKYEETKNQLAEHGIRIKGSVELDLKTFMARKDKVVEDLTKGISFLFRKNAVTFVQGEARLVSSREISVKGPDGDVRILKGQNILVATGSSPLSIPGIEIDEKQIVSSTGALSLSSIPGHLVVIGGGYIGLELGSVWRRLGARVTIVEYMGSIVPAMDREAASALFKALRDQGIEFRLSSRVVEVSKSSSVLNVALEPSEGGKREILSCDVLLCCAGRKPHTSGLGLEDVGVALDERGYISVNDSLETTVPGIYAVGDVIRGPMLAHKAEEEAIAVAEILAGQKPHINYGAIPAVVYTCPEVASVGQTEEELKKKNRPFRVGKFPFSANSRARPNGDTEGFVKILADSVTDEILGVHIIHPDAGTLIAEAVLGMEYRACAEDIARTCHAHPTLNEALKEAALAVDGRALHV